MLLLVFRSRDVKNTEQNSESFIVLNFELKFYVYIIKAEPVYNGHCWWSMNLVVNTQKILLWNMSWKISNNLVYGILVSVGYLTIYFYSFFMVVEI